MVAAELSEEGSRLGPENALEAKVFSTLQTIVAARLSDRYDGAPLTKSYDLSFPRNLKQLYCASPQYGEVMESLYTTVVSDNPPTNLDYEDKLSRALGASLEWITFYDMVFRLSDERTVVLSPEDARKLHASMYPDAQITREGTQQESPLGHVVHDFYVAKQDDKGEWHIVSVVECTARQYSETADEKYFYTKPKAVRQLRNRFPSVFDSSCDYQLRVPSGSSLLNRVKPLQPGAHAESVLFSAGNLNDLMKQMRGNPHGSHARSLDSLFGEISRQNARHRHGGSRRKF